MSWRNATDPVVRLLRRGVLVVDGEEHDKYRGIMDPPMQRRNVLPHIPDFWRYTDQVTANWRSGETYDMLVEMRKLALLILMGTTFKVDFAPDLERLWQPILDLLEYISPGIWILWAGAPTSKQTQAGHPASWMNTSTASFVSGGLNWPTVAPSLTRATCWAN